MELVRVVAHIPELKIIINTVVKIYAVKEKSLMQMVHVVNVQIIQEQLNLVINI